MALCWGSLCVSETTVSKRWRSFLLKARRMPLILPASPAMWSEDDSSRAPRPPWTGRTSPGTFQCRTSLESCIVSCSSGFLVRFLTGWSLSPDIGSDYIVMTLHKTDWFIALKSYLKRTLSRDTVFRKRFARTLVSPLSLKSLSSPLNNFNHFWKLPNILTLSSPIYVKNYSFFV